MAKVPTGALVVYTDGGCDDNRKSRVTRTLRSTGAQAYDQKPAGWGFCVFEMAPEIEIRFIKFNLASRAYQTKLSPLEGLARPRALPRPPPGDSSAGLVRLKPIAELFGPVVNDESDPLFLGADGHSNNTGELLAVAEARLWLKDTFKGPARCIRTLC